MRLAIILLIAAMVALSACSGPAGEQPAAGNEPAAGTQAQAPAMQDNSAPSSSAPGGSNSVDNALMKMFDAQSKLEFTANYKMTVSGEGGAMSTLSTEYFKGKNMRTDTTFEGIESRTYIVDDVYTTCTKLSDTWKCNKVSPEDLKEVQAEDNSKDSEMQFEDDPTQFEVSADGTKVVAGETTTCYKMKAENVTDYTRWCFTKDGISLYVETAYEGGSSVMEAQSFSRSVPSSAFDLPAGAEVSEGINTDPMGLQEDPCSGCSYLPEEYQADCLSSCSQ